MCLIVSRRGVAWMMMAGCGLAALAQVGVPELAPALSVEGTTSLAAAPLGATADGSEGWDEGKEPGLRDAGGASSSGGETSDAGPSREAQLPARPTQVGGALAPGRPRAEAESTVLAIAWTAPGQLTLSWPTEPGKTYTLQDSSDLTSWDEMGDPISGDGMDASVAVTVSLAWRYYRLQIATSAVNDPYPVLLEEAADRYAAAMGQPDLSAALEEFVAWLQGRPEVSAVWTTTESTSVTVEAADGILYAYVQARPLGSTSEPQFAGILPAASSPATEPLSPAQVRMPQLGRAGLFYGCGPDFTDAGDKVSTALQPLFGANIDRGDLTLERLQHLSGYDLLLLDSHGDLLVTGTSGTRFALSTVDEFSDPAVAVAYSDDFEEHRLVKMVVVWEEEGHNWQEREVVGAFPEFIEKYNTVNVNTDCLVIVNACYSNAREEPAGLFLGLGASAYVGWTDPVGDKFSSEQSIPYFVDRLAMVNVELPHDPPMRPLSVAEALLVMQHPSVNVEYDAERDSHLVATAEQPGDEIVLRPTIRGARASGDLVGMEGFFGEQPGSVYLDSHPLTVHSWDATLVVAELSSEDSSGRLTVTSGNLATSNEAELVQYGFNVAIHVSHPFCEGTLVVSGECRNVAGAFLSASPVAPGATGDDFGWEPIERTFFLREGVGLSWELSGSSFYETDTYWMSMTVNSTGARPLGGDEWLYFLMQDEQVYIQSSVIKPSVWATVTRVRKSDDETENYSLPVTVAPNGANLLSTADHDMETGIIGSGQSVLVVPGLEPATYQFEWGQIEPSPRVDIDKPR